VALKSIAILSILLFFIVGCTSNPEQIVKFRLIDEKGIPLDNEKILVCDDALKIHYQGEYPYYRFCDGEARKIITETKTEESGIFLLDVKNINVFPPTDIVLDVGETPWKWKLINIERSNNLAHEFHQSYLRVLNQEKDGHVISNKIFNLETKQVKEIFTNDKSEIIYPYEIIDLTLYPQK